MASTGFTCMTCSGNRSLVFTRPGSFQEFCMYNVTRDGNGSHPTMKNCEGSTGTCNRLLRGQGRSFQVIEAPRGRPFGGGAGHRITGLALPDSTGIVQFLWETLSFQQIEKHLLSEGTVPVSPNRPCALRWCCITFSGIIAPEGMPSGGGGGITCRSPKRALRKIF